MVRHNPFRFRQSTFKLDLTPGEWQLFLLIESDVQKASNFNLLEEKVFWREQAFSDHLISMFLGSLVLLTIFSLIQFYYDRRAEFGYYFSYLASMCLGGYIVSGYPMAYIWPQSDGKILTYLMVVGFSFAVSSPHFFAVHFLDLDDHHPLLAKALRISGVFHALNGLFIFPIFPIFFSGLRLGLFILVSLPLLIGAGLVRRHEVLAKFYLTGWCLFLGSGSYFVASISGLLPYEKSTIAIPVMGFLLEAILFAIALAYKSKIERKTKTDEIRRLNEDLTKKIHNLSQVATGLAHEVNNPLMIIQSSAEFLSNERGGDVLLLRIMRRIQNAVERIADTVLDIKIFTGKENLFRYETVDMDQFMKAILWEYEELNISYVGRPIIASIQSPLVRKAVKNLIENASEALSGQSMKSIYVELEHDPDLNQITLRVRNSSLGASIAPCEQIFDPFYTTKEGARGMGLATARGVARAHGGELWLETSAAMTTFSMVIPLVTQVDRSQGRVAA